MLVNFLLFVSYALIVASLANGGNLMEVIAEHKATFSAEKDERQYVVAVDVEGKSSFKPQERTVTMTDSKGKQYVCDVPGPDKGKPTDSLQSFDPKVLTERMFQNRSPGKLLDAFSSLCFYRVEDWWTYEVCYKKNVRQFHNDALSNKPDSEYRLGQYSKRDSQEDVVQVDKSADARYSQYVQQTYTDGEACDLTKQPRRTEVRYICDPDAKDGIVSILEPASCQYLLYVATPKLCSHPDFQQAALPLSLIRCSYLDTHRPSGQLGNEDEDDEEGTGDADDSGDCLADTCPTHEAPVPPSPPDDSHNIAAAPSEEGLRDAHSGVRVDGDSVKASHGAATVELFEGGDDDDDEE